MTMTLLIGFVIINEVAIPLHFQLTEIVDDIRHNRLPEPPTINGSCVGASEKPTKYGCGQRHRMSGSQPKENGLRPRRN